MPAVIWPVSGGSRSRIPGRIRECQSWGRTGEGGLQNYGAKMCILAGSSAHSKLLGPHRSRLPHPRCSEGLVLAYGGPRGRPGGSPRPTPIPAWKTRLASSLSWCFSWLPGCSFPLSVTSSPFSACTFVGFFGGLLLPQPCLVRHVPCFQLPAAGPVVSAARVRSGMTRVFLLAAASSSSGRCCFVPGFVFFSLLGIYTEETLLWTETYLFF